MSLILIYLGIVFYVFMFDVEMEYLFLYIYATSLILSPLKVINKNNFNLKQIEGHFLQILRVSFPFFLLYIFQMLYYDNFQINRILFHFDSDIMPDSLKGTISFYKLWMTSHYDPNSPFMIIGTLLMDAILLVIKIVGLPFAIIIVLFSILYMIFIGGFIALVNSVITVLIIIAMLYPFFIANENTKEIANIKEWSMEVFFQKYLEISKIILFFIFVAV